MAGMPWEAGAVAGIGTAWASRKVMSAILTDPQIARNVIYALDRGSKAESYGPFIAGLIASPMARSHGAIRRVNRLKMPVIVHAP